MKSQRRGSNVQDSKETASGLCEAGWRHFKAGRFAVAQDRVRRALAREAQHPDALHLAGLLDAQAGRLDLAIDQVGRAVQLNQGQPAYLATLGTLLGRRGRIDEALKSFGLALKLAPDNPDAWVQLGDLLKDQQRHQDALRAYASALSLDPRHLDAVNGSALLLLELQQYAEALARFEQSNLLRPGRSSTLFYQGLCLQALGRLQEAVSTYGMALAADAKNYDARNNLGGALFQLGRFAEAASQFEKAVAIRPDAAGAFSNLGFALFRLRRYEEALKALDRAVALDAASAEARNLRGNVLRALNRPEQALVDYDRAIVLQPQDPEFHSNRGNCLDELMRPDEASSSHQRALALDPNNGDAHWNFAINRLRVGDFSAGWREAEWRWRSPTLGLNARSWKAPLWLGRQPITGKVLLLHNDQGLGDAIQFSRYIPHLAERGAKVVLEIEAPLAGLLSRIDGLSECVVKGAALPDHDVQAPLASLPLAFDTTLETIPSRVPYLSAGDAIAPWEDWLGPRTRPRVGLVWSGNPDHLNDHNRSVALSALLPLLACDAQFVSLQKNVRDGDLAMLRRTGLHDAAPRLTDFSDAAALVSCLDLVITVDTSVAHLAGALGRPTWILLPYIADYRWLLGRDDSPWYPTARLFRQTADRNYGGVLDRVKAELGERIRLWREGS